MLEKQCLVETSYQKDDVTLVLRGVKLENLISQELNERKDFVDRYLKNRDEQCLKLAQAVAIMSEAIRIYKSTKIGKHLTIVSMAGTGTNAGILSKRYLNMRYPDLDVTHYSIGVTDNGIDINALKFIASKECLNSIIFVDGSSEDNLVAIKKTVKDLAESSDKAWKDLDSTVAVLSDPCKLADIYGTSEDIIIPDSRHSVLMGGLVKATEGQNHRECSGSGAFYSAAYFGYESTFVKSDKTYEILNCVVGCLKDYDDELFEICKKEAKNNINTK